MTVWSAAGLTVRPTLPHTRDYGVIVTGERGRLGRDPVCLPTELVRSLRDWLTWYLGDHGDTPPPPDPDRVRLAIDEQRAALMKRSLDVESEDFRAGLAWAANALDAVHHATGAAP